MPKFVLIRIVHMFGKSLPRMSGYLDCANAGIGNAGPEGLIDKNLMQLLFGPRELPFAVSFNGILGACKSGFEKPRPRVEMDLCRSVQRQLLYGTLAYDDK